MDEDKALKELQGQWGMTALALSRGIIRLEATVLEAVHTAETNPDTAGAALSTLKDKINAQVVAPLAHAFRLAGRCFNNLSGKHCKHIAKGVRDQQVSKWLEATPESTTQLFPDDMDTAMQASHVR